MKLRLNLGRWLALLMCAGVMLQVASASDASKLTPYYKALATHSWDFAENGFREFIEKNPNSDSIMDAVLGQAQALIGKEKYSAAIDLLNARQSETNKLADQFLFWKGEAYFQSGSYAKAAETFGKLAIEFRTSTRRLEAAVGEATSRAKLGDWPKVVDLLKKPEGAFRQATRDVSDPGLAAKGFLLLAEAELQQRNYREAEDALKSIKDDTLVPTNRWHKQYLVCRAMLGAERAPEALGNSTNLIALAEMSARKDLIAESVAFRAKVFEQLRQPGDASALLQRNLADAPPEWQRQAVAKIADLALSVGRVEDAIQTLENFQARLTNAAVAGEVLPTTLLAVGELHLRQHLAAGLQTSNHLALALTNFDKLIAVYPSNSLVGKAQLDRGWSLWSDNNFAASAEAFKVAVNRLPPSGDAAVAQFKLGDAYFLQKDYTNALQNYRAALSAASAWPRVKEALASQGLYQILRSSLELKDTTAATDAMTNIVNNYPRSVEADRSILLVGQSLGDFGKPEEARAHFQKFIELFPDSPLRPQVELALARTFELKADWLTAAKQYDAWMERFPTNQLRSQADFYRSMAAFRAGDITNALSALTNFAAQNVANELAPLAQWTVADYYYNQGAYLNAEIYYKDLINNWPKSSLAYDARMMAGQAALRRGGPLAIVDAIFHFTNLTGNAECPTDLRIQATLAYGGALVSLAPRGTNASFNYQQAIGVFSTVPQLYPGSEAAALAQGEIANCWRMMAGQDETFYSNATNAYRQVIDSPKAGVAARSEAWVGMGLTFETHAARKTGAERTELLKQALECYQQVIYSTKLREGESAAVYWVKEAGMKAARLLAELGDRTQAKLICEFLAQSWPELRPTFEKRIADLREGSAQK